MRTRTRTCNITSSARSPRPGPHLQPQTQAHTNFPPVNGVHSLLLDLGNVPSFLPPKCPTRCLAVEPGMVIKGGIISDVGCPGAPSGDGTVPYASLEHARSWQSGMDVRISHLREAEHRGMLAESQFHQAVADALTPNYWEQKIEWRPIHRGDRLPVNAVFVGQTATDWDVLLSSGAKQVISRRRCVEATIKVRDVRWCPDHGRQGSGPSVKVQG